MLNDEVINKVIDRIVLRIEETNTYVLKKMAESVGKLRTLTPTQARQLAQIMRYGGDYDKITRALAKMSKLNIKDIKKIFEEIAKKDYEFAEQFYKYRNKKYIPYKYNKRLQDQVEVIRNITADEYVNITRTMGFATKRGNKIIYNDVARTYQNLLDTGVMSVSQGKATFDEEMSRIIKELSASGLKTVDYASGRSYRLDSAVRMALQGGLRTMHMELQEEFGKEFDADGVEISVHINPAPDHMFVQGKQFRKKEFQKFQNDEDAVSYDGVKFPAISDETGYDRRSIGQYNCYHYIFSIVLGVSNPNYTNEELQNIIDNTNKKFTFDGKEYNMYEGTQLQRKIERAIREQKDRQIMAKACGNADLVEETQLKITQLTQKYKELSDVSGLPTQLERARVTGYRRTAKENVPPKVIDNNLYYEDMTNEFLLDINKNKKAKITNAKEVTINGKIYKVNKQNPIIHEKNEVQVAEFIQKKLHMDVKYEPNINEDKKVHLGDFEINGKEIWELKSPIGNAKNTISNNLKEASHQASIIMLDITETNIPLNNILNDINNGFRRRNKIERVILKKNNNILKVLDKKKD